MRGGLAVGLPALVLIYAGCAHERAEVSEHLPGASPAPTAKVATAHSVPADDPPASPSTTLLATPSRGASEQAAPAPNAVPIEGEGALYALATKAARAAVTLGAFEVACLAHDQALEAPAEAAVALEAAARAQEVALGQLLFVRLERDPARAGSARPRACRPVSPSAELYAPLFRARAHAGRWRVAPAESGVAQSLARLLEDTRAEAGAPADRPHGLVIDGRIVLFALPFVPAARARP